jgi:hypothetical protein
MTDAVGRCAVSVWSGGTALSLLSIACICLCIALMTGAGKGESPIDELHVAPRTENATFDPTASADAVQFNLNVWSTYYDWEYSYDVMLRIDHPQFSRCEFVPDVIEDVPNEPRLVQLKVYVPDDILAGTYELPVLAHAFCSNGTYEVVDATNVTIVVLEDRRVPVEFAGGNIIPYYADIPQIIHHLLLSNEGNTAERVLCRYLTNGTEINTSVWSKGQNHEVRPENPIQLAPGEFVVIDVVFFLTGVPDEDGTVPITIEVFSSEDGKVLDSIDSQVYKSPKEEEESWDWVHASLIIVAVLVLALILFWHWRGKVAD